jgi:hypothetical protein
LAAATEDSFDAAVSVLEMARARGTLCLLPDGDDADRIEGRIWTPLCVADDPWPVSCAAS